MSAGIPRRGGAESGAPKNPSWYTNLVTHPTVRLQDGATVKDFHARLEPITPSPTNQR
jgi:F420H(2)-dependent quinone reductase